MKRAILAVAVAAVLLMFPAVALASDGIAITVIVPRPETVPPQPPAPPPNIPRLYPVNVRENHGHGRGEIVRIYELRERENPAHISRESFERGGYLFELAEIARHEIPIYSAREHVESFSFDTQTDDLTEIIGVISPTLEGTTPDGYSGVLTLDISTIVVESQGTQTHSRLATRTREFPHLSNPDTSLIPRIITEGGNTYNLADVEWRTQSTTAVDFRQVASTFTAVATYTRTAFWTTNIGYTTTAKYQGQVSRLVETKAEFTVRFIGIPIVVPIIEAAAEAPEVEDEFVNGDEVQIDEVESEEEPPNPADYYEHGDYEYVAVYDDSSGGFPVGYIVLGVLFIAGIVAAYFVGKKGLDAVKKASCVLLIAGMMLTISHSAHAVQLPRYGFGRSDADNAVHFAPNRTNSTPQASPAVHVQPTVSHTHNLYNYGDVIGVLTVERLGRTVNVIAGATMEAMDYGAGHFSFTGLNVGNTGLIGHNRGLRNGFFSFVRELREGDILILEAGGITRRYSVAMLYIVHESDFSPLAEFGDNRLTLVTCVEYRRNYRRIAVAVAID